MEYPDHSMDYAKYECSRPAGLFTIERSYAKIGDMLIQAWQAVCREEVLCHARSPEEVLEQLLRGDCKLTPKGIDPASVNLPDVLSGWKRITT